ncbi:multiheme c-type cytochrome [Desulfohalovibrio reitneri]|uniref:multiheme c-type cytochrome n=1 Tax=Desulfohalovibrio reitneri TaxID=1307759 RepID=UPI001F4705BC|nr:multiheme c-type cytochrome [Desulfohalovibrio reitneri]
MPASAQSADAPSLSSATQDCLSCHETLHPGIVEGWRSSRHRAVTPGEAMQVEGNARKVSSEDVPEELRGTAVGCAECHTIRHDAHADTFDHMGYQVHIATSPDDCATCHATEREQYSDNIMAHARANLTKNPVFTDLVRTINGVPSRNDQGEMVQAEPSHAANADACFYCHGTELEVTGTKTRDTMYGPMDFPVIKGWPNNGVGRVNLDGSKGSCAACHTRHTFAIEQARSPATCKECHNGPDVPAYKVYSASKHGNIYEGIGKKRWNFSNVPWTVGKDFTAPTCATCHISLVTTPEGEVVAERTHAVSDRLPWRIFGLPYAHPQPKEPTTHTIKNANGLPLPTTLDNEPASEFLIDKETMDERRETMQAVCRSCHGEAWVDGHWDNFEQVIQETNQTTLAGTRIMQSIWEDGLAKGLAQGDSIFDEYIERTWSTTWLFYANTVRFSSAMAGGGDYGVFADGRYQLMRTIRQLEDWRDLRTGVERE